MKTLTLLAALTTVACATAPEPAPTPAAPPPAAAAAPPVLADPAPVTDGDTTVGWFHGMKILVKRIPGADFVAGDLFIRGGVRNWGSANAGVEQLALATAAQGGTQSMPKDAFTRKLAAMGSILQAGARDDYSNIAGKALAANWDATFAMMVDAFLHPALPATEVELERERQLSALKHEQESPDGQLRLLVHQALFKGHPYQNRSIGTPETVKALTTGQLAAHLGKLRETSRLLLVVVGDVDAAHVIEQASAAFASVPRGSYVEAPLPDVQFDKAGLTLVERKLPTNYIEGTYTGPHDGSPDSASALLAGAVLGERVFEEVRTKRNLSYAPHAGFDTSTQLPRGFLYVTATQPNETMKVMYDEVHRLQTQPVPEKELTGNKSVFLTGYYMGSETTDGQAQLLGRTEILWGDWHVSRKLPEMIHSVSAEDVQKFAQKYIAHVQTVVLGSPEGLDQGLFKSL